MIPAPLTVRASSLAVPIVKALAPGLKIMLSTVTAAEVETTVWLEKAKVAVSEGALGTVCGVQLVAAFQFPLRGFCAQVALPAFAA